MAELPLAATNDAAPPPRLRRSGCTLELKGAHDLRTDGRSWRRRRAWRAGDGLKVLRAPRPPTRRVLALHAHVCCSRGPAPTRHRAARAAADGSNPRATAPSPTAREADAQAVLEAAARAPTSSSRVRRRSWRRRRRQRARDRTLPPDSRSPPRGRSSRCVQRAGGAGDRTHSPNVPRRRVDLGAPEALARNARRHRGRAAKAAGEAIEQRLAARSSTTTAVKPNVVCVPGITEDRRKWSRSAKRLDAAQRDPSDGFALGGALPDVCAHRHRFFDEELCALRHFNIVTTIPTISSSMRARIRPARSGGRRPSPAGISVGAPRVCVKSRARPRLHRRSSSPWAGRRPSRPSRVRTSGVAPLECVHCAAGTAQRHGTHVER